MRPLVNEYKLYDSIMGSIKFEKLDCWNLKAPDGFMEKIPKELLKHEPLVA